MTSIPAQAFGASLTEGHVFLWSIRGTEAEAREAYNNRYVPNDELKIVPVTVQMATQGYDKPRNVYCLLVGGVGDGTMRRRQFRPQRFKVWGFKSTNRIIYEWNGNGRGTKDDPFIFHPCASDKVKA